jgi:uncharacterized protein (TIGR02466 family)
MPELQTVALFPTTIGITNVDIDFEAILNSQSWEWSNPTDRPVDQSSQRSQSTNVLQDFPEVKQAISEAIGQYCHDVLRVDGRSLTITTSWLTKAEPGIGSARHFHTNSYLSAVWYPATSSPIRFFAANGTAQLTDCHYISLGEPIEYNLTNGTVFDLSPEPNRLVIFPSMFEHQIMPNTTSETRYSLAVNTFPVGAFGQGDSALVVPIVMPG